MPAEAHARMTALQALQGLYHCAADSDATAGDAANDWPALLAALPARADFMPGRFDPIPNPSDGMDSSDAVTSTAALGLAR